MNFLGIDLGASYAKAVYRVGLDGPIRPVADIVSKVCTVRVCGSVNSGNLELLSSDEQRLRSLEQGHALVENVKPLRGRASVPEPLEVLALQEILARYAATSGDNDLSQIGRVLLTHPVSPRPSALNSLVDAAVAAGIPRQKIDTVEEPVALAVSVLGEEGGEAIILDGGHYTTDLARVRLVPGSRPVVRTENYLGGRVGAAELYHALGRSAWLKAQLAAGIASVTEFPFDERGIESGNQLVSSLMMWAEGQLMHRRQIGWFAPGRPVPVLLDRLVFEGEKPSFVGERISTIAYCFSEQDALAEDIARSYPHHSPERAPDILAEYYLRAIGDILSAIQALLGAFILELDLDCMPSLVVGGGLTLIPEVYEAVQAIALRYGGVSPREYGADFPEYGALRMARLLGPAAGAAILASQEYERQERLSDNIGLVVSRDWEEAIGTERKLGLIEEAGALPIDFCPELDGPLIAALAHGAAIVPVHSLIARRGEPLPTRIELSDWFTALGSSPQLLITRPDDSSCVHELPLPVRQFKVARIDWPSGLVGRIALVIERNDRWQLEIDGVENSQMVSMLDVERPG